MRRTLVAFSLLAAAAPAPSVAQTTPPALATDIPAAAIAAVLNSQPPAGDKLIKAVDIGAAYLPAINPIVCENQKTGDPDTA